MAISLTAGGQPLRNTGLEGNPQCQRELRLLYLREKDTFFILGKKTHILLVVSFFFLYSFYVLALSIQEKKRLL